MSLVLYLVSFGVPLGTLCLWDWMSQKPVHVQYNLLNAFAMAVIVQLIFYWQDPALFLAFMAAFLGAAHHQLRDIKKGKREHTSVPSAFICGTISIILIHYLRIWKHF